MPFPCKVRTVQRVDLGAYLKAILFFGSWGYGFTHALCSLIQSCGSDKVASYRNVHEIIQYLAKAHLNGLLLGVCNSCFFSILIDEATDAALSKQLIMYIRFMTPSGPVTCILEMDDGTVLTIYTAICNKLKVSNLDLGFVSDSTSRRVELK